MSERTYGAEDLRPGTRVETPHGPGSVNYVRLAAPPSYAVAAVSVWVEARHRPGYSGTIYRADQITLAPAPAGVRTEPRTCFRCGCDLRQCVCASSGAV